MHRYKGTAIENIRTWRQMEKVCYGFNSDKGRIDHLKLYQLQIYQHKHDGRGWIGFNKKCSCLFLWTVNLSCLGGVLTSFVVAIISIKFLLFFVKHNNFIIFEIYRIVLSAIFLVFFLYNLW